MKHLNMTAQEFLKGQIPFEVESVTIVGNPEEELSENEKSSILQVLRQSHIQKLNTENMEINRLTLEWWFLVSDQKQGLKGGRVRNISSEVEIKKLYQLTSEQWLALGQGLKYAGIQELDLGFYELYQLTSEQWLALGQGLKGAGVQRLNLFCNDLGRLTSEQWVSFCEMLKGAKIQQLDLGWNQLFQLTPEQWLGLEAAGIQQLDLKSNDLYRLTEKQWLALGQVLINARIRELNLENNHLGAGWYWTRDRQEFHPLSQVRRLNLKNNDFKDLSSEEHIRWIDTISVCKDLESLSIDSIPVLNLTDLIDRLGSLYEVDCEHPEIQQVLQRKAQVFLESLVQGTLPKDWNDEKISRIGALIENSLSSLLGKEAAWENNFLASLEQFDFEESATKNGVIVRALESLQTRALKRILSDTTINIISNEVPETMGFVLTATQILDQLNGNNASVQKAFEMLLIGCNDNPSDMPRLWDMIRSIQAQDPKEKNFWGIFQTSLVRSQAYTWETEVKDLLASYVIGLNPGDSSALQETSPAPLAASGPSAAEPLPSKNKEEKVPPLSDYGRVALSLCSEDSQLYTQLGPQLLGLKLGQKLDESQEATLAQKVATLRTELGMTSSLEQTSQAGPASPFWLRPPTSDQPSASQGDSSKEEVPPKAPGQFG